MSVIISMMRVPEEINAIDDFPEGFVLEPLGSYAEVMAVLRALFPDADYSDPTWISVSSGQLSEIIIKVEDHLYIVGFRNPSFQLIQNVFEKFGWRGMDPSDGKIIPPFIPPEYYGFLPTGS